MLSSFGQFRLSTLASLLLVAVSGHAKAEPPPFEPLPTVAKELAIGDLMPDVPLRGADGQEVRLRDFRGKALAITFFYSRCAMADFCPLVGRNFDIAQTLLQRMGVQEHCHLLSISLDPRHDTAEVLSAYGKGYQADPQLWTFATGEENEIQKLGDAVGLEYRRVGDRIDHNLRTVIVDASGHIRRVFRGDAWTPQELSAELSATARQYH